jgi:ethanolamine utilization protein EutA (predicted chaperonin)
MAASRQHVHIDLDAEVASILRSHAAEAQVSEGEIVDRAIRAYDLRLLVARIHARSDLDEDAAMALVREELQAARAERADERVLAGTLCGTRTPRRRRRVD